MLNDAEGRLALAREHADELRREIAATRRANPGHVSLRMRFGRLLMSLSARGEHCPPSMSRSPLRWSRR